LSSGVLAGLHPADIDNEQDIDERQIAEYPAPEQLVDPGGKTRLTMEARRRLFATRSPGPR
jgi:hypothetical protein